MEPSKKIPLTQIQLISQHSVSIKQQNNDNPT